MSNFPSPASRTTKENINQLEATLDAALEHASHGWNAMEKDSPIVRIYPDLWPPAVDAPVGSVPYHFAAMIDAVYRAYQIIRTEQDRINGIESPNTEIIKAESIFDDWWLLSKHDLLENESVGLREIAKAGWDAALLQENIRFLKFRK